MSAPQQAALVVVAGNPVPDVPPHGAVARFRSRVREGALGHARHIRRNPSTLGIPVALCVVLLGLGCTGITWLANRDAESAKRQTTAAARDVAAAYKAQVVDAYRPLLTLAAAVRQDPQFSAVATLFNGSFVNELAAQVATGALRSIVMAPFGVIRMAYPQDQQASVQVGTNVLGGDTLLQQQTTLAEVAKRIASQKLNLVLGVKMKAGYRSVLAALPIFVAVSSPATTFGGPDPDPLPRCGAACYDAATGRKFWGMALTGIDLDALGSSSAPLFQLWDKGYRYQLVAPASDGLPSNQVTLIASGGGDVALKAAVEAPIELPGTTWVLYVAPSSGSWTPDWYPPVLAVYVVMVICGCILLYAVMHSRRTYMALLQALLPRDLMQELVRRDSAAAAGGARASTTATPADVFLKVVGMLLEGGGNVELRDVMYMRAVLQQHLDIYTPTDLRGQLRDAHLDGEVARALARQLGDSASVHEHQAPSDIRDSAPLKKPPPAPRASLECGDLRGALAVILTPQPDAWRPPAARQGGNLSGGLKMVYDTAYASPQQQIAAADRGPGGATAGTSSLPFLFATMPALQSAPDDAAGNEAVHAATGAGATWAGAPRSSRSRAATRYTLASALPSLSLQRVLQSSTSVAAASQHSDCGGGGGNSGKIRSSTTESAIDNDNSARLHTNVRVDNARRASAENTRELCMCVLQNAPPPLPVIEEVERQLALADSLQYDSWKLADATQGHPLSALGFYLLHRGGRDSLIERFHLNPAVVARLLRHIEAGYNADCPYHNATHAADVLQTLHVIIHMGRLNVHYLDPLGLLAAYLAAMVHDLGHPGVTGDFLVATADPLALLYNDRSPLENHHCASAFAALATPELDALAPLSRTQRADLRKQIIEMVLATDMKQHFPIMSHFNTVHRLAGYSQPSPGSTPATSGSNALVGEFSSHKNIRRGVSDLAPRPANETERLLGLQVALKAADLGHLGEDLHVHKRWLAALEEEFFRQGDRERQLGLPISPLFDRDKQGASKSQGGFFKVVAMPLADALAGAFPGTRPLQRAFQASYNHWQAVELAAAVAAAPGGGADADGGAAALRAAPSPPQQHVAVQLPEPRA